jgi:DNA invertase Pin-like site-specific DNA recombinase
MINKVNTKYQEKRNREIVKLRNKGLTYQEIADRYGIKWQRAQKIYKDYKDRFPSVWEKLFRGNKILPIQKPYQ